MLQKVIKEVETEIMAPINMAIFFTKEASPQLTANIKKAIFLSSLSVKGARNSARVLPGLFLDR